MGTRCADHVTPLYPQQLALTSPTGGGRSVGIVRVRTKATELVIRIVTYLSDERGTSENSVNMYDCTLSNIPGEIILLFFF